MRTCGDGGATAVQTTPGIRDLEKDKMKNAQWSWLVAVFALVFAIAPFVTEPFSGYTADQLPIPQDDPVIQPPGWAFAIWGVIYTWLVAGAVFGVLRAADNPGWAAMRPPLVVALGVGAVWLWIANASAIWGTVTIFIMAAAAILSLLRTTDADWWWQTVPVGLFAGWLTAASGVSASVTLAGFGVMGAEGAGRVVLLAVLLVALWVQWSKLSAWPYAIGVGWALFGVAVTALAQSNTVILLLALGGLIALAALVVGARMKQRRAEA